MDRNEMNNVVKLALDAIHGRIQGNFSILFASETLRKAFIEANGGSTTINIKTFHRGNQLFDIIEELLPVIIQEGLQGDEFFFDLVEYRNMAEGDMNEFYTEDKSEFIVADVANGTQGIRRQRLNAGETLSLKTSPKAVKVYEELRRMLAGRVDFNTFIDKVSQAMTKQLRMDIYNTFNGISATTAGLNDTYVISGTYDEAKLLELIEHVEAKTGQTAKIVGTKTALRKVATAVVSDEAKSDLYNIGYYGKLAGTDMIAVKQVHKTGTDTFMLDNNKLYIIAGSEKPIKVVNEGEGLIVNGDPTDNSDLTQEYTYIQNWGVGVIFSSVMGIYTITD